MEAPSRVRLLISAALLLASSTSVFAQGTADRVLDKMEAGMTGPKLLSKVEPAYTSAATDAGVQGMVLIGLVVNKQGLPQDLAILSPLGFGLDESALHSVAEWRFRPAMKDGKPVNLRATVEVSFRLTNQSFDTAAEKRRTRFNVLVSRLSKQNNAAPSPQDMQAFQQLAKDKLPAAEYLVGAWEFKGEVLPKDAAAGLQKIESAADKNYGPALFFLGNLYRKGDQVAQDENKGMRMIRDASVLGSKQAQFMLGNLYENGGSVPVDLKRAARYFRLCAASGSSECQFRLAKLLLASPGDNEQDRLQAVAWLELAQTHHLPAAEALAQSEAAKLTPEQTAQMTKLRDQLERKQ